MDAPTGTAVALASLLGVPFVRLRVALPDELLGWDIGTALGRRRVLSKEGMDALLDQQRAITPSLFRNASRKMAPGGAETNVGEAEAGAALTSDEQDELMEEARSAASFLPAAHAPAR
jgi:hypothetical protein